MKTPKRSILNHSVILSHVPTESSEQMKGNSELSLKIGTHF